MLAEFNLPHEPTPEELLKAVNEALDIAFNYSQVDGGHHKAWCIDQMVRALTGSNYDEFIRIHNDGEDGPETYEWDEGIAP